MKTLSTPQGEITLLEPTAELLQTIRSLLPFGLIQFDPAKDGATFGIVMHCGEWELFGVGQRVEDCLSKESWAAQETNNLLIAHSLATYLKAGFAGLFLPCVYERPKPHRRFESSIAYFGCPLPQGRESLEFPHQNSFDHQFGTGFTTMVTAFLLALRQSALATRIPLIPPTGLDVRYCSDLGYLNFGFMLVGPQVVCLKRTLPPETDPVWALLRGTGISTVFHLPSIPAKIAEAQLPLARSSGDLGVNVLPQLPSAAVENRPPSP